MARETPRPGGMLKDCCGLATQETHAGRRGGGGRAPSRRANLALNKRRCMERADCTGVSSSTFGARAAAVLLSEITTAATIENKTLLPLLGFWLSRKIPRYACGAQKERSPPLDSSPERLRCHACITVGREELR